MASLQTLIALVMTVTAVGIAFIAMAIQIVLRIFRILWKTTLAPVYILIGSIPGQEGQVQNLFKGIIADCAAFPAISFVLSLTGVLLGEAMKPTFWLTEHLPGVAGIGNVLYAGFFAPLIIILCLILAFKAPSMVANAINPPLARKK